MVTLSSTLIGKHLASPFRELCICTNNGYSPFPLSLRPAGQQSYNIPGFKQPQLYLTVLGVTFQQVNCLQDMHVR